jgi:alanyl-tRNA synthetase
VTDRLYYTDSYLSEFDAETLAIVDVEPCSEGARRAAVLDRTAFYPTSGGQPHDTGVLGAARVVDVVDGDDGQILHVFSGELASGPVRGRIDWDRRFEHMQQHTGQHVLSAAFARGPGARTLSFHLGSESATIDLDREIPPAQIASAALEANRIVWEDRPVSVRFADAAEAARLPLRKESAREGAVRLIDIDRFDLSACGGTHVARTGAIGVIAVASWERVRGGTRVEFLCGIRALRGYAALRDTVAASTRLLSVLPADLPQSIERVQADARESRRLVKELQGRMTEHEAAALVAGAEVRGGVRLVVETLAGFEANGLKAIASAIAAREGHAAVLLSAAAPASVVVATGAGVSADAAAVLKRLTEMFGGKGGGRADLAQGGGLTGTPTDIAAFARTLF